MYAELPMAKIERHPSAHEAPLAEQEGARPRGLGGDPSGSGVGEAQDDDSAPRVPRLADRYEILSLLGAGSMGNVYKAHDTELDEIVALKILRPELASAPNIIELFRCEVKLARRVTHPNVARMFDIGQSAKTKFLTMEYVDGPSLVGLFERGRGLGAMRLVEIARAVATGLVAAHASGVVHRDLKPENVLIASDGRVVVTDFGIASAVGQMSNAGGDDALGSHPRTPIGSPAYMSPEQVQGLEVDPRSDLYSLGVLMFEGLTGALPFRGGSFHSLAAARLTQPIPDLAKLRPGLPVGLAAIVVRCLARSPGDRYASASDLVCALDGVVKASAQRIASLRPTEPLPAAKSLAVLPFLNPGEKESDALVESLWNDVVDALSTTQGLRVRPGSTVARFTGRKRDPVLAGRETSVDAEIGRAHV